MFRSNGEKSNKNRGVRGRHEAGRKVGFPEKGKRAVSAGGGGENRRVATGDF
jgi:hypothetical protein